MSVSVEELGPKDAHALRSLLVRDVPHHLHLLAMLEEFGAAPAEGRRVSFWGAFRGRELTCAVFVGAGGALVLPTASEASEVAAVARELAGRVRARACHGEPAAVDALCRAVFDPKPRTQLALRLYKVTADDLGPFTNPALRPAAEADLPRLLPLAAAHARESLRRDPLAEDAAAFEARVLRRIRARRTWVLESGGRVVFKVDVTHRSPFGAELEAPYTLPEERGRGHATLSLGQLSRQLLSSLPRLVLRVEEANPALSAVVRKVGFVAGRPQRLVLA